MKKWIVLGVAMLAGCAGQPADQSSGVANTQADTDNLKRARAFTDLAAAYYARAQYKIALDELRKAITADNRYGPAYHVYGLIYMDLDEDKLAEDNFRRAIDLDREDSEAHNDYDWFLCTRNRYKEKLDQFSTTLQNPLYTRPEQAMTNAGLCAEKSGDLVLAEANLMKSLKLQPDNPNTILKLAALNFHQDRLPDAQRLLDRYAELAQPSAESLWLGVRLQRKLGNRSQEAAYGLQLRKNFPDSNEARLLLAGQYE